SVTPLPLECRRAPARLRGPEVLERDGDARAPLAGFRAAERGNARGSGEVLAQLGDRGGEQRPGGMANGTAPERATESDRVELVALDEELLERARVRPPHLRARGEARLEVAARKHPLAAIPPLAALHARGKIGKADGEAGHGDRQRIRGIQAEEPDAGSVPRMRHVGAEVQLVEVGQRWNAAHPAVAQREGCHRHPGKAVALVDRQARVEPRAQLGGGNAPVQEEQVGPVLVPDDHAACPRRNALRAEAASSFGCTGFTRASTAPRSRAARRRLPTAETAITGACGPGMDRTLSISCSPSSTGMIRSVITTSGRMRSISESASRPSYATVTCKPSSSSAICVTSARSRSSSANTTRSLSPVSAIG